jgi:hypothetical protein
MSSLRPIDLRFLDELVEFVRGRGYVLDFSDARFSEFFATELNVDIDDPIYAVAGSSKGNRLRHFLGKVDDVIAIRTLTALWEYRGEMLARTCMADPVPSSEGRFLTLIHRLSGGSTLPPGTRPTAPTDVQVLEEMRNELYGLRDLAPQPRGYAFEAFLKRMFDYYRLHAREAFRNTGEQIDGSFLLNSDVYLLEAKWTRSATGVEDLHAFHGKLDKAAWTRGLFVSFGGFTSVGLQAFGTAKRLICLEGRDLYEALGRQIPLPALLEAKVRRAAETGRPFVPIDELFKL